MSGKILEEANKQPIEEISDPNVGTEGADSISMSGDAFVWLYAQGGDDKIDIGGGSGSYVEAGAGNDTVRSSLWGSDTVFGDGGNDDIVARWGNDIVFGGDGNDTLDGHAGDDTLSGGAGEDELKGGYGGDVLFGDGGNDLLIGQQGDDTIDGGNGEKDIAGYDGKLADYNIGGDLTTFTVDAKSGSEGKDHLSNVEYIRFKDGLFSIENGAFLQQVGTDGADTIAGSGLYFEHIQTLAGDDKITVPGSWGSKIEAGAGNDSISGSVFGGDNVDAGAGDDKIKTHWGHDFIDAGAGNDTVDTGAHDDTVNGGAGDDQINGGYGNEYFMGGSGNDTLSAVWGDDTLDGGDGVKDVAKYREKFSDYSIEGDIAALKVTDTVTSGGNEGSDSVFDVEYLLFKDGMYDVLQAKFHEGIFAVDDLQSAPVVDAEDDVLGEQVAGEAFIISPDQLLENDSGEDLTVTGLTIVTGSADITPNEDGSYTVETTVVGVLTLRYTVEDASGTSVDAQVSVDITEPEVEAPEVVDDVLPEQTVGTAFTIRPDDLLENDIGTELSVISIEVSAGEADITGNEDGSYTVEPLSEGTLGLLYQVEDSAGNIAEATVTIEVVGLTSEPGLIIGTQEADDIDSEGELHETVYSYGGDDQITIMGSMGSEIHAGDGDDWVQSSMFGDDVVYGGKGNDSIKALWGDDLLYGGDGNDTIDTGAHNDTVYGGAGEDKILGGYGTEILNGGDGNDTIQGSFADDTIDGGEGEEDAAIYYGKYTDYEISGGLESLTITDIATETEGDEGTDTVSGVEILAFEDGLYDVVTGEFTEGATLGGGGDMGGGGTPPPDVPGEVQKNRPDMVDPASVEGGFVSMKLQNISETADGDELTTFAHIFKEGDVNPEEGLSAVIDGVFYDIQMDVKATYDSGAVKHAVLTVNLPKPAAGETVDMVLSKNGAGASGPALTASDVLAAGYDFQVSLEMDQGDGTWTVYKGYTDYYGARLDENTTRYNDRNPMEIRFEEPQTETFTITVSATFEMAGGATETITKTQEISPAGSTAFADFKTLFGLTSNASGQPIQEETGNRLLEMELTGLPEGASIPKGINQGDGSKAAPITVDAAQLLSDAIASGNLDTWLSGPNVSEFRVKAAINEDLTARFDIRMLAGGETRTDMTILNENPWQDGGDRTYTYDVKAVQDGTEVITNVGLVHHRDANWHEQVWSDGDPVLHTMQDVQYLASTGAVPNYDLSLPVVIDTNNYTQLESHVRFDPLQPGNIMTGMPNTGERPDIGLLPDWSARFVLTQDYRDKAVMLANGDASGSVPWHVLDAETGDYTSITHRTKFWYDYRTIDSGFYGDEAVPAGTFDYGTGYSPDNAHQPSVGYAPYLYTGDRYYANELEAQANWATTHVWTAWRDNNDTNDLMFGQQLRGFAWTLRTVSEAATILPDDSAHKANMAAIIDHNLQYLLDEYVNNSRTDERGMIEGTFNDLWNDSRDSDIYGSDAFWQDDYLAETMGLLASRGFTKAMEILDWQANVLAGRYISSDLGMPSVNGGQYIFPTVKANDVDGGKPPRSPDDGEILETWAKIQDAIIDRGGERDEVYTYTSQVDNTAKAMAGLTAMMTHTDNHDAFEAYGYVVSETQHFLHNGNYQNAPRNSHEAKLKDGTVLRLDEMQFGGDSAEVISGDETSQLIHGGDGNDTLVGNEGIDLLYGGNDDDEIGGGDGNDYLFGNDGDDAINGGAGDDVIRGNVGSDTLSGDLGDDILYYQGDDVVSGGAGRDTLALQNWREADINLSSGKITGIEVIDLRNTENATVGTSDKLTFDINHVASISDTGDFHIFADADDMISITGDFVRGTNVTEEGVEFAHLFAGETDIYIQLGTQLNDEYLT